MKKRDERGSILIMSVAGLALALVASALAVDLGRQAQEKKSDQVVADLAALDAARDLANATAAAEASAQRNGFDPSATGHSLVAEVGTVDADNEFTAGGSPVTAVRVTISSTMKYLFDAGGRTLTAEAVAKISDSKRASFDLGSALASLSVDDATILNNILGPMIGGNADVLSWQGLGNATLTVDALRQELANAGVAAGTPGEMLASDVTLRQVYEASADAMDQNGDSRASIFRGPNGIIAQANSTATFKLGDYMAVEQGNGQSVADSTFNVRDMVVGTATLANGSNTVNVPNAGITIPGVTSTSVSLQVTDPRQSAIDAPIGGPFPDPLRTAQTKLTITPLLNMDVDLSGLGIPGINSIAKVTGSFPFTLDAAGADAKLTDVVCAGANPASIQVGVDTKPMSGAGTGTLRVTATAPIFGTPLPLLDVPTAGAVPSTATQHTELPFAWAAEFAPNGPAKRAGTSPIGLQGLINVSTSGSPTVLGIPLTPAVTQQVVDRAYDRLKVVVGQLDDKIVSRITSALGLGVGSADVNAFDVTGCDTPPYPVLVG